MKTLKQHAQEYAENWEEETGLDFEKLSTEEVSAIDFEKGARFATYWRQVSLEKPREGELIITKTKFKNDTAAYNFAMYRDGIFYNINWDPMPGLILWRPLEFE